MVSKTKRFAIIKQTQYARISEINRMTTILQCLWVTLTLVVFCLEGKVVLLYIANPVASAAQWLKASFEWISINFILVPQFCLLYYLQASLSGIIHWNQVFFSSDLLLKVIFFFFVCGKVVPWVGHKALLCLELCCCFACWTLWSLGLGMIWEFPSLQKYWRDSKLKTQVRYLCGNICSQRVALRSINHQRFQGVIFRHFWK